MPSLPRALALGALVSAVVLAACGEDPDAQSPAAAPSTTPTTTAAAEATTGTGSGAVTIAGTSFAFDGGSCRIGKGESPELRLEGSGAVDGRDYDVVIRRQTTGSSTIESAQVVFDTTVLSSGVNLQRAGGTSEAAFAVDGAEVTGELSFDASGDAPTGPGTITATCDG